MVIQAAAVTSAIALWVWLLADGADRIVLLIRGDQKGPIFCTRRHVLFAAPAVIVASLAITFHLRQINPEQDRIPLPCGHGVDYDTRDGLCYKFVPLRFRRQ